MSKRGWKAECEKFYRRCDLIWMREDIEAVFRAGFLAGRAATKPKKRGKG